MKRVKRGLALLLCLAACLSGCAKHADEKPTVEELRAAATFYPLYALCAMIAEDVPDLHLSCLVQPQDGDPRDYAFSDWDLSLIAGSDAIFCGGSSLESFESALYALGENGPAVAPLLRDAQNPYIYLTADGAIEILQTAEACFATLDPKYEAQYLRNYNRAKEKTENLRSEMHAVCANLKGVPVAVLCGALACVAAEYEMDDVCDWPRGFGENLYGDDLRKCLDALETSGARIVLLEKQAPERLVNALADAGFVVARLDTMTAIPASSGADGYFNALRENAAALGAALESSEEQP